MARSTHAFAWSVLLAMGCGPTSGIDDDDGQSSATTLGSGMATAHTQGLSASDTGASLDPNDGETAGSMGSASDSGSSTSLGTDSVGGWPDCPDVHEGDLVVDDLTDVDALATIGRVTGGIDIRGYTGQDLEFLSCLHVVDLGVRIRNNPSLMSLAGLENLADIGASLRITGNPQLESLAGLGEIDSLAWLTIRDNAVLHSIDLDQIEDLAGLELGNCPFGPEDAELADNPMLENLDGLSGLQSLNRLVIGSQSSLVSLGRLHEIAAEGGISSARSMINYNPNLPYAEIDLLEQLSGHDFYSCGNLGEPEGNSCYCDNPG